MRKLINLIISKWNKFVKDHLVDEDPDDCNYFDFEEQKNKSLGYSNYGSYPFGLLNNEIYLGKESSIHSGINKIQSRDDFDYPGRIWRSHPFRFSPICYCSQ